jgi:hypothetical protein
MKERKQRDGDIRIYQERGRKEGKRDRMRERK